MAIPYPPTSTELNRNYTAGEDLQAGQVLTKRTGQLFIARQSKDRIVGIAMKDTRAGDLVELVTAGYVDGQPSAIKEAQGMTVRELIEALQQYPDDLMVIVDGYESGYDPVDADSLGIEYVKERVYDRWSRKARYDGVYEEADEGAGIKALLIERKSD